MAIGNFLKGIVAQVNPWDNGANYRTYNPKKKREDEEKKNSRSISVSQSTVTQPRIKTQTPKNAFETSVTPDLRLPTSNRQTPNPAMGLPQKPQTQVQIKTPEDRIPGYKIMSPAAQKAALDKETGGADKRMDAAKKALLSGDQKNIISVVGGDKALYNRAQKAAQAQKKKDSEEQAKVIGNIPLIGTGVNWGTQLAGLYGRITGNKDLQKRSENRSNLLTLGMNTDELKQYDPETQGKLKTLKGAMTGLGALDIFGATSLFKAPIIAGGKEALKEGIKTAAGKEIIKESLKQTGKQYGKNIGVGALVSAGVDPAIQAYVKDGDVDWSTVPSSMLQGGLWAAAIPEFTGKARLVQKLKAGERLTAEESKVINTALKSGQEGSKTKIEVKQPRSISFDDTSAEPTNIPVTNNTPNRTGAPIKELGGDTPGVNQVKIPTADEAAAARFANQPQARPDSRIEGITPRDPREGVTREQLNKELQDLELNRLSGNIDERTYQESLKALGDIVPIGEADPNATKINVKEVNSIPVTSQTDVPANLPEAPGEVRVTAATAPNNARTAEIAAQTPALPPEVQTVLDNPKKFTKAQVASARNQRKLARQMAKTQEQTAEAMDRIQSASPGAQSGEGFVPTGEFGRSVNGGAYQKTNRQVEMAQAIQETSQLSPGDVIRTAREGQAQTGGFNRRDIRNIAALFEQKRIPRNSPEYNEARQILKEDGTIWGQTGALRNYTIRRTASADELLNRFESKLYRLVEDPSKIDSKMFDDVELAETKFADTRDAALQAYNRFTENPTTENAQLYHAAQDAAEKADRDAKMVEYKVASQALKGNKDVKQARELEKMAQQADMYQMDAVDASMLSGTGTFVRNFVNAAVSGVEEGIFGKAGARIASKLTKQSVGGGFNRGNVGGFIEGGKNIVDASKARAGEAGINVLEHGKNWATTGNQLGDTVIDSQVKGSVLDHYTQLLKGQGFNGQELTDRAGVMARQDPDNIAKDYTSLARVSAGLGSGITRNNKIETTVKNIISDAISGGKPNKVTEGVAKLITRMTLGFPTAIGRSLAEGTKRFTLGAPTFVKAFATKDPQARALLIKEGVKQAGSGGMVVPPLFYALGASGAITGAYPKDDEAERARWEREGITENSIKIGNDYYQLPAYLGSWAIPGLFYASLGRNNGDFAAAAADTAKIIPSLLPTDQMANWQDVISGRSDLGKFMAQTGASAVRAATPVGALLAQIAKSIDPTQNDTNSGTVWENLVDKVINGIPVASLSLENKTDDAGNELTNPNLLALAMGASSTTQGAGVEQTDEMNDQTNSTIASLNEFGAFSDPNLKAVITDDDTKKIYNDIVAGKQVTPDDIEKVQKALAKGVSAEGTDTAYLEREQYDSNLAALNIKRSLMEADPTTKPSSLADIDTAIKRGQIYKDNQIPYDLIKEYQTTGVSDWRKMGDPESDEYDPDKYQQLWAIDELMTQAGVSYKKGELDKQKYSAKAAGKGRGRGGGSFSSDFGTLKAGTGAPTVQQYDTIDQRSGGVPVIQVERPNIVHKIGFSG